MIDVISEKLNNSRLREIYTKARIYKIKGEIRSYNKEFFALEDLDFLALQKFALSQTGKKEKEIKLDGLIFVHRDYNTEEDYFFKELNPIFLNKTK